MTPTQTVAVVGEATQTTGLAELFARCGFDVQTIDPAAGELPRIEADLLIEVVAEAHKADVLRALSAAATEAAILVTTTSVQSVTQLASTVAGPGRLVGLHWGPDGLAAGLVEVVAAELSDTAAVEELGKVAERLEFASVVVKDNPGFLVDWLFLPYLNDVIGAYDEELATAEDIDVAIRLGLGYRKGPFQMLEEIGVEQHLTATSAAYEATHDHRFAPPALLRRMAASRASAQADDSTSEREIG